MSSNPFTDTAHPAPHRSHRRRHHTSTLHTSARSTAHTTSIPGTHLTTITLDSAPNHPLAFTHETRIRIASARFTWALFVRAWTAGVIPSHDWLPTEMAAVFEEVAVAVRKREGERVSVAGLRQWFLGEVWRALEGVWGKGERVRGAVGGWVPELAMGLVRGVGVEVGRIRD